MQDITASDSLEHSDHLEKNALLVLKISIRTKINFASAQNSVSILRTLIIENTGDAPAKNVALNLRATPTVLREKNWYVDHISAHSSIVLGDLDTPLDTAILGGLNEAEIGQLEFTLKIGDEITAQKQCRIELLARDEWGGLSEMENILAAFVSPNQPQVARLLKDASRLLEAAGYSGSMDGYQSNDPQRTWMIAGAIWSAATGLGLTYAVPPASFEREGQKIRDPERIVSEGLATCLDSALLLAAAFEAAGLHTAILFAKGHAWVGVWLIKHDFGKLLEPDVITVRKAVVSREFVALESTLLTKRPSVGFEQAVAAGNEGLSESRETEFELAIDINRARAARIRPLASHQTPESNQNESETRAPADLPKPLNFGLLPGEAIDEAPSTALGRIERWQRKLLDLSLANKLLNFKDTKLSIPLLCPTVATLEDGLASGKTYRLLPLKDENAVAGRDLSAEQTREIEASLARDALDKIQIAIPLSAHDMSNRLTELYRKARSDIQEGGTNTLFLVAGFLRWKRPEDDERHYRAPLLLIPVKLERRSAQSEFRLTQLEDEVRINATLLEFLKRDFDLRIPELEGDLPHDENGLDIPRIFELMRRRVRDVSGFEVLEECALSTFSFAKYLMWKDLVDRTDSLRESPLVRHLVDSPSEPFAGAHTPMPHPRDMDRNHVPADILAPLPADSSQLAAVAAAATGRDFVLVGPPGTGKSQTITNIIADQLGRGRTILFVAEKAAALDVVQRRLERQGLGSAVLELHSNKADRKVVFQQLGRSWERATSQAQDNWVRVTDELRMTRDQLNDYVTQLHLPGTQGFSIYQAIGRAVGSHVPFTLQFDNKDCHDEESWRRLRNLAIELGQRHTIIADLLLDGALSLVPSGEWSYSWQDTLLNAAQRLKSALRELETAREAIADLLGCDYRNSEIRITLDSLPTPLLEQPAIDPVALQNLAELRSVLPTLAHILAECSTARQALSAQYEDQSLASIPLETLDLQWREAQTKFWPLSTLAQGKVRKLLQTYASGGSANPATDLTALRRLVTARTSLDSSPFTELSLFAGEASDPAALKLLLDQAEAYLQVESTLINAGISRSKLTELRPQLLLKNGGSFKPLLERLKLAQENFNKEQVSFASASGQSIDEEPTLEARLAALPSYSERLSDWLKWQSSKRQAQAVGLAPLVESLEAGIPLPDTGLAFESAYMSWWLKPAMDASPALRSFAHWEHDALIKQFRSLDQTMTELVSGEVLRRLGNELPTRDSVPRRSELGLLRHQLGLQRPTAAIRSLIADMPTTFTKLAPCVLMSPLSVAQYLPPGQAQFDLVIFDEASQISTWDAIGAIARGRQAIIVGDPKQLPPTHFFGRSDEGESGQEEVAEFEKDMPSILDEAGAAGIPTHLLSWHYRSRDEALIAFSNYHYYDGSLVTFPSPNADGSAVRLHKIKGAYMRGQGRTNPDEARAVVAMIRARLTSWLTLPVTERPTLGVITFNVQQQGLILDLLDAERQANPEFEWFFSDDREEALIVKNLENIQGDERDVMLFSITFGPDHAGKLSMNFGALNNDGGEKRLNVAVTRARAELHVFSSLSADQIDLNRTAARGVKDLKAFLDFANRGAIALAAQDAGSVGGIDSPFEQAVYNALTHRGWEVHTQIGVSGFRIDLGIRHPDHAGAWLAGVECDGATYHRSATARDRDRIRQAVLEGLGWRILRIWSTDWFRHPSATAERIDAALQAALAEDRARREAEAANAQIASPILSANDIQEAPDTQSQPQQSDPITPDTAESDTTISTNTADVTSPPLQKYASALGLTSPSSTTRGSLDPERFFDHDYTPVLATLVQEIVAREAPISAPALARRIAQEHGWQRTGSRIQKRLAEQHPLLDNTTENMTLFLWSAGQAANRIAFRGLKGRTIREISRTEIASVEDQHAVQIADAADPVLELSRLLGIARLTQDTRHYLEACRAWRSLNS